MPRPMNRAPEPSAKAQGRAGVSSEPNGVEGERVPTRLVGEYCPLLKGFDNVLVPEMNTGQLKTVLRDQFLVDARPLTKVSGQPFRIAEIEAAIGTYFDGIPGNEGGVLPADRTQLPDPLSGHDDGHLRGATSPQSE